MKRASISRRMPERESNNFFRKRRTLIILAVCIVLAAIVLFSFLKSSPPKFSSVSVYPPKIKEGEVLLITAQLQDMIGIVSAYAEIENEEGYDKAKFYLSDGTPQKGTWKADWVAHATKNQKWYNLTIKATNIFGKTSIFDTKYFDPVQNHSASEVTAGTFDSGNFVFPNHLNINGNLTIGDSAIINSTILLKPESSPTNQTGYTKIYYKQGETVIDSYTKLLLHMDGSDAANASTATDSSIYAHTIAGSYGSAQLDTAQKEFGSASLLLDGTGDYITYADSDDWAFGAGDFTIDMWVRYNTIVDHSIVGQWDHNAEHFNKSFLSFATNTNMYFYYSTDGATHAVKSVATDPDMTTDTWYHLAWVRSGNNLYFFKDGLQQGATQDMTGVTLWSASHPLGIGARYNNVVWEDYLIGWIDELRISKGIARWTSGFSVPTAQYANIQGGLMFMHENGTSVTLVPA